MFQLHPGAWHFAAGHIPKLELLGQDCPYVRTSNGQFSISVSDLQLRLPVHEVPGAPGTPAAVGLPLAPFSPSSARCTAVPTSRIAKRAVRATRHEFFARGNATERQCPGALPAVQSNEHVAHVFVSVYRSSGHGRCRFLRANGRLTAKRSCAKPVGSGPAARACGRCDATSASRAGHTSSGPTPSMPSAATSATAAPRWCACA